MRRHLQGNVISIICFELGKSMRLSVVVSMLYRLSYCGAKKKKNHFNSSVIDACDHTVAHTHYMHICTHLCIYTCTHSLTHLHTHNHTHIPTPSYTYTLTHDQLCKPRTNRPSKCKQFNLTNKGQTIHEASQPTNLPTSKLQKSYFNDIDYWWLISITYLAGCKDSDI